MNLDKVVTVLANLATLNDPSSEDIRLIAELIRTSRDYRWVGIYEVGGGEIAAMAWTGNDPPAHPRFPVTQGLCGAAVQTVAPVVVGDVSRDPRYLTTFGSTQSEIIVPIIGPTGQAIGLIDVESERLNAFEDEDQRFLQRCASALLPIFVPNYNSKTSSA